MVFVKVRETYDLHTVTDKITAIGIHTPGSTIIKRNFPGLLMQCKTYRPVSCDVRVACASMLPADPLQVSTTSGDIAPEDLFNPILYKACTNQGMSQIEARIQSYTQNGTGVDVAGDTAVVDNDSVTSADDEFDLYYGMLADTNQWRHASPQAGFTMKGLKPLVYEMLYSIGDNIVEGMTSAYVATAGAYGAPSTDGSPISDSSRVFKGRAHTMPMINTTGYSSTAGVANGFLTALTNNEITVPAPLVYVGCIIVPPSRLHQLYYRMVVEWTLEFSQIRSMQEITNWTGLTAIGAAQHYQSYSYSTTSKTLGVESETLVNDTDLASANVEITKVM